MTKQDQFLYVVQTVVLTNGINLTSQPEHAEKYRHVYSASGVLGLLDEALWASERIPENLSAYEAAHEFCGFMLENLREAEETATEHSMELPSWLSRAGDSFKQAPVGAGEGND